MDYIDSIYNANDTMKLIGKQNVMIMATDEVRADAQNIIQAHKQKSKYQSPLDYAYDFFLLGVIYGKRLERKRRKVI